MRVWKNEVTHGSAVVVMKTEDDRDALPTREHLRREMMRDPKNRTIVLPYDGGTDEGLLLLF